MRRFLSPAVSCLALASCALFGIDPDDDGGSGDDKGDDGSYDSADSYDSYDSGNSTADSGDTGGSSDTCQDYCSSSYDCSPGEACLNAESGQICLPASCQSCWDNGYTCSYDGASCTFSQCGPSGNTCKQYCSDNNDCNAGQSCLNTADGYRCLNPQCANCFAAELDCYSYDETCEFSHCG